MVMTTRVCAVTIALAVSALPATAQPSCDTVNYNNQGAAGDVADYYSYLFAYSTGSVCFGCNDRNFNNDLQVDNFDVEAFASRLAGGPCVVASNSGMVVGLSPCGPEERIDFNNDGLFYDPQDLVDWARVFTGLPCTTGDCDSLDFNLDGTNNIYDFIALQYAQAELPCVTGSLPTSGPTCDSVDFNADGIEQDPTDIEAFLSVYSGGPCVPAVAACNDLDFNNDAIEQDPTDIEAFLSVYSGGPCL